jgi:hypothetical protein
MELWELDHLVKNYQTSAFNLHTAREFPFGQDYGHYSKIIYIENTYEPLAEEEIKKFGGICLDFSHLENTRLFYRDMYEHNIKIIEKYGCGCNHIGPAKNFPMLDDREKKYPDSQHPHFLKSLSELDYLKKYPANYFGNFLALELQNGLREQLKARDYIVKLLA